MSVINYNQFQIRKGVIMKKGLMFLVLVAGLFFMTGCSNKERVPSGDVGKILTSNGFAPEILQPGAYIICGITDKLIGKCYNELILLDMSEGQFTEVVTTRMKDNMNLKADHIRIRVTIKRDPKIINSIFNQLKPNKNNEITLKQVYNTYGKLIVTRDVREVLSKYTIDEVRLNYARISAEIYNKIKKDFANTPLLVLDFSVGRFVYPKTYEKMVELAKQKQVEIKKIEAENIIKLKKAKADMELAKARYAIKMQEAKRIADYNKMIGKSVTPQLLELRKLEVQEKMMDNLKGNPNVVYMPYEMMNGNMIYQLPKVKK